MSLYLDPRVMDKRIPTSFDKDCIICDKKVIWFGPGHRIVHIICANETIGVEEKLKNTLQLRFFKGNDSEKAAAAYMRAIKAVKAACAPDSILAFLERNGEAKLKELFDTIGIQAAFQDPAKM